MRAALCHGSSASSGPKMAVKPWLVIGMFGSSQRLQPVPGSSK
jgi:hypothetical protein